MQSMQCILPGGYLDDDGHLHKQVTLSPLSGTEEKLIAQKGCVLPAALVTTLLMVLVLGAIAVGVVWMASAEKKTSHAEQVHVTSVLAADAAKAQRHPARLSISPARR